MFGGDIEGTVLHEVGGGSRESGTLDEHGAELADVVSLGAKRFVHEGRHDDVDPGGDCRRQVGHEDPPIPE